MKKRQSTIYLKDNTFIPDFVVIPKNTNVSFVNDDATSSSYSIQCRQLYRVSEFAVRQKECVSFPFPNTGRFEITCPTVAHMKCVVEVCDDTEACEMFFVDKECKPLSSSALKSQQKQELKECDAVSLLQRSRSSWAASAVDKEEQEEDMSTQRRRQKAKTQSLVSPRISSNAPASSSTVPPRISTSPAAHTPLLSTFRFPKRHREVITIRDYSFDKEVICVTTGSPLEFRLHESVPGHVEHELFSTSTHPSLVFESPVLQQPHMHVWQFIPRVCGEMDVSCHVYGEDMLLKVIITDAPPPASPASEASTPSVIKRNRWGCVVGTGEVVMSSSSDRDASESSFADSDDDDSFASDDTECPAPCYHDHVVVIEDFYFRPSRLTISCGDSVKIISNSMSTLHKISCDEHFDSVTLEKRNDSYTHCFDICGQFRICNDIFSFMVCDVAVEEPEEPQPDVPSPSQQPFYFDTENEENRNYYGTEQNIEQSVFEYRMQKMHVLGSFPASPMAKKRVEAPMGEDHLVNQAMEDLGNIIVSTSTTEEENNTMTAAQKRRERRKKKKKQIKEQSEPPVVANSDVDVPGDVEPPAYDSVVASPTKPVVVSPLKDASEVAAHVDWGLACDSFSDSEEDVAPPPYSEAVTSIDCAIESQESEAVPDSNRNCDAPKLSFPPLIAKYNSLLKGADWSVVLDSDSDNERDTPSVEQPTEHCSKENRVNSQHNNEAGRITDTPKPTRKNKHKSRKKKGNAKIGQDAVVIDSEEKVDNYTIFSESRNDDGAEHRIFSSGEIASKGGQAPEKERMDSLQPKPAVQLVATTSAVTTTVTTTLTSVTTSTVVASATASTAALNSNLSNTCESAIAHKSASVDKALTTNKRLPKPEVEPAVSLLPAPTVNQTPRTPEKAEKGFMAILQTASAKKRSRAAENEKLSAHPPSEVLLSPEVVISSPPSQLSPSKVQKLKEFEQEMENFFLSRSQDLRSKAAKKERDILPRGFQAPIVFLRR